MALTGGHWASLSAATSWTLRCLVWDFPLVLISLVNTYTRKERVEKGRKRQQQMILCHKITVFSHSGRNSFLSGFCWLNLLLVRRSSRRQGSERGRSLKPAEGGWLCLHLKSPAVSCGQARRCAPPRPGSGLQKQATNTKLQNLKRIFFNFICTLFIC